MSGPVRAAYDELLAAHELKPDQAQERAVAALDRLAAGMSDGNFLSRLFGGGNSGPAGVYLWGGVGRGKSMLMDLAFAHIDVGGGRTLHVPKSLKGVAVFSFKRLCGEPRGASDYLAIARRFHTVIIVGIPVMTPDMRNEAARFVTLIDALYEHKVKLLAAADAEPEGLYPSGDGSFEFQRTVSRLEEMRSAEYLAQGHGIVT